MASVTSKTSSKIDALLASLLVTGRIDAGVLKLSSNGGGEILVGNVLDSDALLPIEAAANTAQATADGKNTVYFSTSAPNGGTYKAGDLWFDTDDGNKIYRWTGSAWANAQDAGIAGAVSTANAASSTASAAQTTATAAQTTADGKIKTYYAASAPTGGVYAAGDLWFDTANGYAISRWSGSAWVSVKDTGIAAAAAAASAANTAASNAMTAAQAAQATADGAITTYYQSSPPWANLATGHANNAGDMWFDTDDGQAYRWNDSTKNWDIIEDNSIAAALAAAQTAQTTADGKITAYYQIASPWANASATHDLDFGDLWYDTDDKNKPYYWASNRTWTVVQDGTIADAATAASNAATAASTAQTTANGKNKVTYSASQPGSTANTAGDIWFRTSGATITEQWQGGGGTTWTQVTLTNTVIANLDAGKITTGTLDVANRIAAGAIDAAKITTDSITASQIATGAITANEIAANAVTANKLNVLIGGGNLVPNSSFETWSAGMPTSWSKSSPNITVTQIAAAAGMGTSAIRCTFATVSNDSTNRLVSSAIIQPSTLYTISVWARRNSGSGNLALGCDTWGFPLATFTLSSTWTRFTFTGTSTAGASPNIYFMGTVNGDVVDIDQVQVEMGDVATAYAPKTDEILPGTIVASQIATGTITATQIATGTITATQIASNTITATQIFAGTLTSASGVFGTIDAAILSTGFINSARIQAGSIAADKLSVMVGGNNLVYDSSFDYPVASWDQSGWIANAGGTLTKSNAQAWRGTQSARVDATVHNWGYYTMDGALRGGGTNRFPNPGHVVGLKYAASVYVYCGTSQDMRLEDYGSSATVGPTVTVPANTWTRLWVTFTAGTNVYLSVRSPAATALGTFYMDAFMIQQADVVTGYFPCVDEIAPGTISASQIAAHAITANEIYGQTITANEIATGAITADKLLVTVGGNNLAPDSSFEGKTDATNPGGTNPKPSLRSGWVQDYLYSWTGTANASTSTEVSIAGTKTNLEKYPIVDATGYYNFSTNGWSTLPTASYSSTGGPINNCAYKRATAAVAYTPISLGVLMLQQIPNLVGTASASIPVTTGLTYTASLYVRSSIAQTVCIVFPWLDSTGASVGTAVQGANVTLVANTWTRLFCTGVAPASAVVGRVDVRAGTASRIAFAINDTMDFAGVQVENSGSLSSYFDGASTNTSIAKATDQKWNGTQSLKVIPALENWGYFPMDGATTDNVVRPSVTVGQRYTASVYVYASNAQSLCLMDIGTSNTAGPTVSVPATTWTRLKVTFTAGSTVQLSVRVPGRGSAVVGTLWLDAFQIESGDVLTAYNPLIGEILPGSIVADMFFGKRIEGVTLATGPSGSARMELTDDQVSFSYMEFWSAGEASNSSWIGGDSNWISIGADALGSGAATATIDLIGESGPAAADDYIMMQSTKVFHDVPDDGTTRQAGVYLSNKNNTTGIRAIAFNSQTVSTDGSGLFTIQHNLNLSDPTKQMALVMHHGGTAHYVFKTVTRNANYVTIEVCTSTTGATANNVANMAVQWLLIY